MSLSLEFKFICTKKLMRFAVTFTSEFPKNINRFLPARPLWNDSPVTASSANYRNPFKPVKAGPYQNYLFIVHGPHTVFSGRKSCPVVPAVVLIRPGANIHSWLHAAHLLSLSHTILLHFDKYPIPIPQH